jgi:hypothetical protein
MKAFDYENAPGLEEIRGYFTQAEWKVVCKSCQKFDKDNQINKTTIKSWLKDNVINPKVQLETRMNCFLSSLDKNFKYQDLSYSEFENVIYERFNK